MITIALFGHLYDRAFKKNITGKYPQHEHRIAQPRNRDADNAKRNTYQLRHETKRKRKP